MAQLSPTHPSSQTILTETLPDDIAFDMIHVEGGSFSMGSTDEEAFGDEQPVHQVTIADFYIAHYPVTQAVWKAVMGADNNPSYFPYDNRPVEQVSWQDTQEFLKKLRSISKRPYRLLTEAEWEYAARGGKYSRNYRYAGSDQLKEVGWYAENSYGETKPVGLKYPNELGLFDMSGNVWEWVEDHWHKNYDGAPTDGSPWLDQGEGARRVYRGGGWGYGARGCRAAYRGCDDPSGRRTDLGFRLGFSFQSGG